MHAAGVPRCFQALVRLHAGRVRTEILHIIPNEPVLSMFKEQRIVLGVDMVRAPDLATLSGTLHALPETHRQWQRWCWPDMHAARSENGCRACCMQSGRCMHKCKAT